MASNNSAKVVPQCAKELAALNFNIAAEMGPPLSKQMASVAAIEDFTAGQAALRQGRRKKITGAISQHAMPEQSVERSRAALLTKPKKCCLQYKPYFDRYVDSYRQIE